MLDGHASTRGFSLGVAALLDDLRPDLPGDDRAGSAADFARAARLRQDLAIQQARAGRLPEALRSVSGVVRLYRLLAHGEPARYRPELALALTAQGLWSSRLGERQDAATALAEAAQLNRDQLASATALRPMRRLTIRVALAVALSNLGSALADLGRHDEATDAAEEAVAMLRELHTGSRLYRMLYRRDPIAFEHCLAGALNNLGVILAERGRRVRAWELAEETTAIYRRLAAEAPVVFESELARALLNLGLTAAEIGHTRIALAATREAVQLHRALLRTQPAAPAGEHRQHLGRALCTFAKVRALTGDDLPAALTAAEEAVYIHEELAERRPQAFSGDLHAAYRTATALRTALGGGSAR